MPGNIKKIGPNHYHITAELGKDANGKRKRIKRSFKGTPKEAKLELSRLETEIAKGKIIEEKKITLGDYLVKWMENYGKTNLSPTTYENYGYIINSHLIPKLGHHQLSQLTPMMLQSYYTEALKTGRADKKGGLSPRSVRYHHSILHKALAQAVSWQIINQNPADAVEPPKKTKGKFKVLEPDQIPKFLEAVKDHKFYNLFYVATYTGLRRSELLGLRWKNVDLEKKTIRVVEAQHRIRKEGFIEKAPKSAKGVRVIKLPDELVEILETMKAVDKYDNLVFCNPDGSPLDPSEVSHQLKAAVEDTEFDINLHGLRHTHATLLLHLEEHPKKVQERLGHSSITVTIDTYSHLMPDMQESVAQKLNGHINGHKEKDSPDE